MPEMLLAGVQLMVVGMTIVYLFLALLVWIITMLSKFGHSEPVAVPRPRSLHKVEGVDAGVRPEIVAAITAALQEHQRDERAGKE